MKELDKTNYKILHQLDLDSRQPSSTIARKIKIPRNIVDYRIKKLVNQGYVRSFSAFIDPCKFGLTSWRVYLQLKGTNKQIEQEMMDYLCSAKQVWWVVKCFGAYDLLYAVLAKNSYELNQFLYAFQDEFGKYIVKQDSNNHLEPIYFSRGYLTDVEPVTISEPFMKNPVKEKMDELDVKIMTLLAQNCRLSSVEIAKQTKTTPRIVAYRIKDLIKRKIIVFYRLGLNLSKFNLEFYKGLLHLSSTKEKDLKSVIEYCRQNKYVNECSKAVGPWQMEIELEVPNLRTFADISADMKSKLPDLVYRIEPLLLYDERKAEFNFLEYSVY